MISHSKPAHLFSQKYFTKKKSTEYIMHIAILGAGLAGLTAAYLLEKLNMTVTVLEARNRIGGRIWTKKIAGDTPVEAGATWFGSQHRHLIALLEELGLQSFPQTTAGISLFQTMSFVPPQEFEVPESEPPSYRISGGSASLTDTLAARLTTTTIHLNDSVETLDFTETGCTINTQKGRSISVDRVISTIPPRLFVSAIKTSPALPNALVQIASETHTWMSDSIKFFVAYKSRFWREKSYSGVAFSQSGIIPEMYDHTANAGPALKGFLSGNAAKQTKDQRQAAVVEQLVKYYGEDARQVLDYGDVLWGDDPYTRVQGAETLFPHQNNGHEMLRQPLFDGCLFMAGSETADAFPGYMDGAVNAARRVVAQIGEIGV